METIAFPLYSVFKLCMLYENSGISLADTSALMAYMYNAQFSWVNDF